MKAVAYLSRANTVFLQENLDELLQNARDFNAMKQVTGVLLFNTGFFFQYIEGEDHGVAKVYERIQNDNRHEIVLEVYNDIIEQTQFSDWCMGFCYAPEGFLQKLSQENWLNNLSNIQTKLDKSKGLEALITFWNNMNTQASPNGC